MISGSPATSKDEYVRPVWESGYDRLEVKLTGSFQLAQLTANDLRNALTLLSTAIHDRHDPKINLSAVFSENAVRSEMRRRALIEAADIRSRIQVRNKKDSEVSSKENTPDRPNQPKERTLQPASLPINTDSSLPTNAQKSSSLLSCSCNVQDLSDMLDQLNFVLSDLHTFTRTRNVSLRLSRCTVPYISLSNAPQLPQLLTKNVGVYSRALVSIQLKLPLHTIPPAQTNSTGHCANIPRPVQRWKKVSPVGDTPFNGTKISAMGTQQLVITTVYQGCFRTKAMTDLQPSNLLYTAKFQQTATSIPAHAGDVITPNAQKRVSKKAVLNMHAILDQLAQGKTVAQCYGEYVQTNNGQPLYGRSMFHKLIQDRRASVATRSEGFVEPDIPSPIREVADVGPA